ncbi:hypothetical protein GE09DRAFT_201167 [Coniochaeta sp. 2T2.1]|nr:hypothetical protein GE09DRAFT_201167 [Coniochaeta sp. 2T2.1]
MGAFCVETKQVVSDRTAKRRGAVLPPSITLQNSLPLPLTTIHPLARPAIEPVRLVVPPERHDARVHGAPEPLHVRVRLALPDDGRADGLGLLLLHPRRPDAGRVLVERLGAVVQVRPPLLVLVLPQVVHHGALVVDLGPFLGAAGFAGCGGIIHRYRAGVVDGPVVVVVVRAQLLRVRPPVVELVPRTAFPVRRRDVQELGAVVRQHRRRPQARVAVVERDVNLELGPGPGHVFSPFPCRGDVRGVAGERPVEGHVPVHGPPETAREGEPARPYRQDTLDGAANDARGHQDGSPALREPAEDGEAHVEGAEEAAECTGACCDDLGKPCFVSIPAELTTSKTEGYGKGNQTKGKGTCRSEEAFFDMAFSANRDSYICNTFDTGRVHSLMVQLREGSCASFQGLHKTCCWQVASFPTRHRQSSGTESRLQELEGGNQPCDG